MNFERQLHAIDDVKTQKLRMMMQQDRDVGEVINWIRENKHLFREQVYEPVILEVHFFENIPQYHFIF